MKNQLSNIMLEGTCSGDVVGGLLSWTVESLQAILFGEGVPIVPEEEWDALKWVPKGQPYP